MNRRWGRVFALAVFLPMAFGTVSLAQEEDLKKAIEELQKGQQAILRELADIKKQLQARGQPAGPDVVGKVFALGANPTKGPDTARLTLLEFTDYQ